MIFTMSHSPYVSIIFVNYRSIWSLSLALQSLFSLESERALFEVIIVNNDKKERQVLERLAIVFPVRIFQSNQNIGFGQGANEALFFARGEVLGFLNPDIKWQEASLEKLSDFFQKQSIPTILGIPLFDEKMKRDFDSYGEAPNLLLLLQNNLLPIRFFKKNDSKMKKSLDWVSGGALFLPKKTFSALGGFHKDFFLYFEDVNLCLRAKKNGVTIALSPFGRVIHVGGRSFRSQSLQKKYFYTSQSRYYKTHRPWLEWYIVRFLHRFFHLV